MLEIDMVDACYHYFVSNNDSFKMVVREVPFLSRCIDMVLITQESQIVTIEFKINNWRKALEQAKNHKLGADKSYICIPEKTPSREFTKLLEQEQIGLYIYNPEAPCIINECYPAPYNKKKVDIFGEMLIRTTFNISEKTKHHQLEPEPTLKSTPSP
jgi:hypothetical protein